MFKHKFWRHNKWLRAEFLPTWVCYISVRIFCFWKMFFAWNPLWFTATNPWFPLGGLYPSSKWDILKQLPHQRAPKTICLEWEQLTKKSIHEELLKKELSFPIIIKPDNGLRGLGVEIFHTSQEFEENIDTYITQQQKRWAWLIQEYIDDPLEIGVFYIRDPKTNKGKITGIVQKEFLSIQWDGKARFSELVHAHPRAKYHIDLLSKQYAASWNNVIKAWEEHTIVEIWTHSRWSTFIDISTAITPELETLFDTISWYISWFHYGRYDVRTKSIAWLLAGEFKIIELNPTYGEPTHMYDPSYTFYTQQKILLSHRGLMYTIAKNNHKHGVSYATFKERRHAKKTYQKLWV